MRAQDVFLDPWDPAVAPCQTVGLDQFWRHGSVAVGDGSGGVVHADVSLYECLTSKQRRCPSGADSDVVAHLVATQRSKELGREAPITNSNDALDVRIAILLPAEVAINEMQLACAPYVGGNLSSAPTSAFCVSHTTQFGRTAVFDSGVIFSPCDIPWFCAVLVHSRGMMTEVTTLRSVRRRAQVIRPDHHMRTRPVGQIH